MERAALITGGSSADVSDADDSARLVAEHRERFGRLDVLVNSAGVDMRSLNAELDADGVRAIVRMALRLSPYARIPQVVIERMGSTNGDVPG